MGPRTLLILQAYWAWLQMAEKAGGHYGPVFQSYRGVTQGDPLLPAIFNMVVGAVIQHWVTVVEAPQEGATQGPISSIQTLSEIFNANDGLVTLAESVLFSVVKDNYLSLQLLQGTRRHETISIE